MDLGFGGSNQVVGNQTAAALLQSTQVQESVIDNEISKYDALLKKGENSNSNDGGDEDDELEKIRQRRLQQMKQQQKQKMKNLNELGHGTYTEIGEGQDTRDVAKEFFDISKKSNRLVVHFYRPTTKSCDIFHSHLQKLSQKHIETKFIKINVEKCDSNGGGSGASYLVEKLGIVVMPTIVIIKDRKAVHHIVGFDELHCGANPENFTTDELAYVIGSHDGLIRRDDEMEPPSEGGDDNLVSSLNSGFSNSMRLSSSRSKQNTKKSIFNNCTNSNSIRNGLYQEEYDDDDDDK